MIDEQNAIQMINLMLETGCQNPLRLDLLLASRAVTIACAHMGWPFDILINIRDREAALLTGRSFVRNPDDFGIDETKRLRGSCFVLALGDIENNHPFLLSNLDGCKANAG